MNIKRNIFANYMGAGVIVIAPILALPWYLSILGPKQFGLISFVVSIQALMGLLDSGMSQALVREVAVRFSADYRGRRSTAALLFAFERIYILFALCVMCIILLLANLIATHWLKLGDVPTVLGIYAIYAAAAIFAAQFPGSLYRSLLVGTHAQVSLNVVMSAGAILRYFGGVLILLKWSTLIIYFAWYLLIALSETLVRGYLTWRVLGIKRREVRWDPVAIRSTWALVAGISSAVWIGALVVQMDKIIISFMLPIEQFGYYVIASSAALGVLQLVYPLFQAVLPRIVQFRANPTALRTFNLKLIKLIAVVVTLGALIFLVSGKWLLLVWLRNTHTVEAVYPLLTILLVGTVMNAFYNVGYMNWIALEKIKRLLQVNVASFLLSVILIPILITWQGIRGAPIGWIISNFIGLTVSLEWIKKNVQFS